MAYESGAQFPSVQRVGRLLAACGLQARVTLEPLGAEIDAHVDAAQAAGPPPVLARLPTVVETLRRTKDPHRYSSDPAGWIWPVTTWALDGATAVCLHGLQLPHDDLELAVLDDPGGRGWLRRVQARGTDNVGFRVMPHWGEPAQQARSYLRHPVFTLAGQLKIRLVDELPVPLEVVVDGLTLPVLPLPAIEQAHPRLAELLERARARSRAHPAAP